MKKDILAALDKGDIEGARDILLAQTIEEVGDSNSWDSPNYTQKVKTLQKHIPLDNSRNKLLTYFGLETLRDRYFLRSDSLKLVEGPQQFFARVAAGITLADQYDKDEVEVTEGLILKATELYEVISKLWFMPATPVLTNTATDRGSTVSCFLNYMGDSVTDIFKTVEECAHLGAGGGGLGVYMGDVRGHGAPIRKTLKSSGPIPFMKILDSLTLAIQQGSVRRCSAAVHMDISHPDVESFIDIRRPTGGDENRRCLNLHHGINITDEFMDKVINKGMFYLVCPHTGQPVRQVDARTLWKNILKNRVETGEPYITYIDSVHKQALPSHTEKGLEIKAGNLCQEVLLPTNKDRTAICVLGSINLEHCPIDQLEYVSSIATEALDNVLTLFLKTANPRDYKRAIYSASKERSIGLGLMGWHGYLMREKIPFEGVQSVALAKIISEKIQNAARAKSIELAKIKGECGDNPGNRNSYLTAIAPTANISIIAGNCTPCIEPIAGNAYLQKTLSGSFLVKNVYLENLLKEKGQNTAKVWKSIIKNAGSVQQLDFLTEEEKKLFKTAYELDQRFIVKQAAARQKHICQAQSLNLFFGRTEKGDIDGKYLHEVHYQAWETGVKTLYYLRSDSVLSAKINTEECVACQ